MKQNKMKQTKNGKNVSVEDLVWPAESHSLPFSPVLFTSQSHWSDSRPLASATRLDTWLSLGLLLDILCHGEPAVWDL